jgi:hypothetical protein
MNFNLIKWFKELLIGKDIMTKLPNGGELWEFNTGDKYYYLNNRRHRKDGPAVEFANGDKVWYINGILHREDGPAIECANGYYRWYLHGECLSCTTQEEFERFMKLKAFW